MKVYKLDEYTHEITYLDIKDELETYFELLQCDCIDVATFAQVPGYCRIVALVDDLGIFHERQATCYYASGIGVLYGTVIFARQYFGSPDFSDILPEDLEIIQRCMIQVFYG